MATAVQTLRDRQVAALKELLNLNKPVHAEDDGHTDGANAHTGAVAGAEEPIWKVLIFDDLGRDVISSVLRVSDLRSIGITLHMHIGQPRHGIEDCPAVYFVEPTSGNVRLVVQDLKQGLYSPAYINFTSSVPRPLLEELAAEAATTGTAEHIAQVYDQYLNFVVAEPDLFSLNLQKEHTYYALNSPKTTEEQLGFLVDRIISGLFSVVATMGVIPVIRCSISGAAEMISTKLDRKLRDHILNSKTNMFSSARQTCSTGTAASRPVLIILDRNIDLTPMLSHSWTYMSLINDVLSMRLNRITVETPVDENNPAKGTIRKGYDLTLNDFFWAKNSNQPFPNVAEDIDAELSKYKAEAAEITKKTGASSIEDLQDQGTSASAQHLKAAISLLPELRERKATLDMHMNVLAALLSGIKSRHLDDYYQLEENAMKQTKAQMLDVIKDPSKRGSEPQDVLRLFLVFALSTEQDISRADWAQFEEALKAAEVDTTSLPFVRQLRATTKMTQLTTVTAAPQGSASTDLFGRFSSISNLLADRLKETGVSSNLSANLDHLIGGIKAFLPANKDYTITKIVESIMDPSTASSSAMARTENFLYFDPRHAHARGSMAPPSSSIRPGSAGAPGGLSSSSGGGPSGGSGPGTGATFGQRRQGFAEALVFVVGGGSMLEYGNLQDWAARTGAGAGDRTKRRVIYGSESLVSAQEFIRDELERLGREVS